MSRELSEDEQRALVNRYIEYGCHQFPSDFDSNHRRDINEHGECKCCRGLHR